MTEAGSWAEHTHSHLQCLWSQTAVRKPRLPGQKAYERQQACIQKNPVPDDLKNATCGWITLAYSDTHHWIVRKNQPVAWEKKWDCPALWYQSLNQLAIIVKMFFQLCWHNSLWGCTVRLISVSWWKMIINSVTQFIATNNCKSTTEGVESSRQGAGSKWAGTQGTRVWSFLNCLRRQRKCFAELHLCLQFLLSSMCFSDQLKTVWRQIRKITPVLLKSS